jgi:hypothetical protein
MDAFAYKDDIPSSNIVGAYTEGTQDGTDSGTSSSSPHSQQLHFSANLAEWTSSQHRDWNEEFQVVLLFIFFLSLCV